MSIPFMHITRRQLRWLISSLSPHLSSVTITAQAPISDRTDSAVGGGAYASQSWGSRVSATEGNAVGWKHVRLFSISASCTEVRHPQSFRHLQRRDDSPKIRRPQGGTIPLKVAHARCEVLTSMASQLRHTERRSLGGGQRKGKGLKIVDVRFASAAHTSSPSPLHHNHEDSPSNTFYPARYGGACTTLKSSRT